MQVTIITICYNPGKTIIKTIESVLAQSYSDYEYIIQDGGSTDGLLDILDTYREGFLKKGISFHIYSGKDNGIYDAMNKAVAASQGEYINFMNAGDCFYSADVLENIFNNEENNNSDLLYGDAAEYEYGKYHLFRKSFSQIQSRMPFSHQSVFVKRKHLIDNPFNTDYKIGADYDFLLTMYDKGCSFKDTNSIVCIISKDGVSSVNLYDTYMETLEIKSRHGIKKPNEDELRKKYNEMKIKQLVMNYFPDFIKKAIRSYQLRVRKQNAELTLPPWENLLE